MLLFRPVAGGLAALLLATPAGASSLVPIPLEAVNHQVYVRIQGAGGTASTSVAGLPEVVLPFQLETDHYTGSGVATASVVGHRIIADLDGAVAPTPQVDRGGSLSLELRTDVRMAIPDYGFPTTSVVLRVPALDAVIGGGFDHVRGWAEPPVSYASEIVGARVVTPPFGTEFGDAVAPTEAVLGSFLAGDVVEIRVELNLSAGGFNLLGGALDGATVVELLAVPEPPLALLALAAVPLALGGRARRARR